MLCALLFLVGCSVIAGTASISAKFTDDNIKSGKTTTLIVEAQNNKKSPISGYFEIVPDDASRVTVASDDRVFPVAGEETTGQRRYSVTASTSSKRQDFEITARFREAETGKILGSKTVVLRVRS